MTEFPFRLRACRFAGLLQLAGLLLGCLALPRSAHAQAGREHEVKAVLLFNLAQFVEWPADAFPSAETPIVIGILGRDPFGAILDEVVRPERINNRRILVERYRSISAVQKCHILFVSSSEQRECERIAAQLRGRAVLTVGDFESFSSRGGMVEFYTNAQKKIRLRVNLELIKASSLNMSSKLLRVAEVVPPPKGAE